MTTPRGKVLYSGDVPFAGESLEALLPLVDEAVAKRAQQPRHPATVVFPHLKAGESFHESAREVRAATELLLRLLEAEAESIAVVYGYINPLLLPHFPNPHWGGHLSGLRFPGDAHYYSLLAALGRFDLIRHDPATGRVLERRDIRSWDVIHSAFGDIRICRQPVDLGPFLREVHRLVDTLTRADDEVVTIRWQELQAE